MPPPGLVGNFDPLDGFLDIGMLVSPPDDPTTDDLQALAGETAVTTTADLLPPPGVLVMPLDPNATTTTLSHSGNLPLIAPDSLWSRLILRVRAPPSPSSRSPTSSASPHISSPMRRRAAAR
ncbi:hypothetical protein AMAG_18067 [Allomyces macrogynus ATCC 38327]|uniref:Uncharacterized protein n=1 Tax=Allomyces macrogynus (strain ATCC 38327) TaxID=578462 RepID=A0A0L0S5C7_ALLM3|nr:hypothetical protein AMAG_18067 [Allomyces macrogynus ATCC 38327]|eukprot:KNE57564.1 hypothetical protein AMAG_18067 [Allomyces macrogynus ATCC 38327]